ncbi:addiction module antidote protein, HigA family [Terrimicrobium sacchariphilum]|uniref:Addiction module antidote protein, HigA family n=1 Tax=Terrimicrobium sacchariphilum TaxID=690879 RepID=A0A146GCZ7_TERSA|nr:HigA family addiction module antitoxin [Terrimicrobium sacchariphilum]GAT34644.1 addiction module antidote protein, HigA family [Terrimicrobium sacchariphilum]
MNTKKEKLLPLVTPGEILREEFLVPLGITPYRIAKDIHVSATAIGQILAGTRAISPDMALRLGAYLGTTAKFWLNLQSHYDLRKLERETPTYPVITPFAERLKAA